MASFDQHLERGYEFSSCLSARDFKDVFSSVTSNTATDIICNRLKESIIVVNNEVYNFNNAYNVWIHFKRYDELAVKKQIEFVVSRFISHSIEILSKTSTTDGEDFQKITTEFKKPFDKACEGKLVKNLEQYTMKLTSDVGFNIDLQGIHFVNGRFNLLSGAFEPDSRTKDSMINSCLPYDFMPPSAGMELLASEYFQRPYKEPGVWEYMKSYIGSCMVGSVKDCEFLLNWGVGGSGKSTLLNILSDIFKDSYCYVGNSEMFNGETQMRMAIKGIPPSARFILIEEIDKVGVSTNAISYIKKLCDGKIDIRDARGHNITTYSINAKMILTSNFLVSLDDTDTGILRRFMTYEYKNRLVLSNSLGSSQIDYINVFPQQSLLDLFRLKGYECDYSVIKSCAFVVFAREAFAKLNGNSVPRPNQYVPSGLELPTWHKFVSTFLEKKTSSRVSKTVLLPVAQDFFKKEISQKDLLAGIQSCGIEYDKNLRVEGNGDIRGAFTDVSLIGVASSFFSPSTSDADSTTGLTAAVGTIDLDCASTVSSELTDGMSS